MSKSRAWCERCERCGEVTPHSRAPYAWRLGVAAVLGCVALLAIRAELGPPGAALATTAALGFLLSAVRVRRQSACERCRAKFRRAEGRTRLDQRSTTTTVDL